MDREERTRLHRETIDSRKAGILKRLEERKGRVGGLVFVYTSDDVDAVNAVNELLVAKQAQVEMVMMSGVYLAPLGDGAVSDGG